jgi:ABC-type amino acid transport substrate-binding protein
VINWLSRATACYRLRPHLQQKRRTLDGAPERTTQEEETGMRKPLHFICTLALAGALAAPALAQKAEFTPNVANCGDPSYENAVKNGINLGANDNPPEFFQDANKQAAGIDWEINKAVLDLLGIKKITVVWMPWESVIPSLLSKRIDVIAADIHVNPERVKVISFSGPAWWYGPVVLAAKGNPLKIASYDDLKGKKVGAITGSAADLYLRRVGVETTPFKQEVDELQSLNQGRLDAVLEDYVEDCHSAEQIAADRGIEIETVRRVIRMVDRAEYKRQQAAPGLKISPKAFGLGRRIPIAAKSEA